MIAQIFPSTQLPSLGALAIKILKIAGLAAALIQLPLSATAQTTVSFAGFGGPLQEAMVGQMFADAGELNIKIKEDRNGFWAGVKAHLMAKAPGWDLTEVGFARCEQAAQADLIQNIDYSVVDKSKVAAALAQPKYVGVYTFSYGLTYQTNKYGANGPKSWADFFDVQKFPGRRTMLSDGLYALEIALIADGVAAADVYQALRTPAGLDRAFAKLETIKPHVAVWYKSSGQAMQLMRDGEADIGLISNARAQSVVKDGTPLTFVWDEAFIDTECLMVPHNAQNPKVVMQLINSAIDPKNQAAFAAASLYGPTNLKAFEGGIIPAASMEWLPSAPQNLPKQVWADQKWYASPEAEAAYQRFAKFLQ
jgi:putative spermidine/putrescine transport system substrate-binding protein